MDLDVLRSFVEVAKEGSVTMAAARLNISQPGLTKRLNALENELGTTLLIRDRTETTLTEAGKELLRYANEMLDAEDRMKESFTSISRSIKGDVFIGTSNNSLNHIMARAVKNTVGKHPGIHFHIRSYDTIMDENNAVGSDFGIFLGPVNNEKYHSIRLGGRLQWGVLMKKTDPLAEKVSVCAGDLLELPVICPEGLISGDILYEWSGYTTKSFNIIMTYNLLNSVLDIAEENIGYVIALTGVIDMDKHPSLTHLPLEPKIEDDIYIVWRKKKPLSEAAQVFLDEFRQALSEHSLDKQEK